MPLRANGLPGVAGLAWGGGKLLLAGLSVLAPIALAVGEPDRVAERWQELRLRRVLHHSLRWNLLRHRSVEAVGADDAASSQDPSFEVETHREASRVVTSLSGRPGTPFAGRRLSGCVELDTGVITLQEGFRAPWPEACGASLDAAVLRRERVPAAARPAG